MQSTCLTNKLERYSKLVRNLLYITHQVRTNLIRFRWTSLIIVCKGDLPHWDLSKGWQLCTPFCGGISVAVQGFWKQTCLCYLKKVSQVVVTLFSLLKIHDNTNMYSNILLPIGYLIQEQPQEKLKTTQISGQLLLHFGWYWAEFSCV